VRCGVGPHAAAKEVRQVLSIAYDSVQPWRLGFKRQSPGLKAVLFFNNSGR